MIFGIHFLLDAVKRKLLPSWIRDGLDLMERSKQKKIEKDRQDKEKRERQEARKKAEQEVENEIRLAQGLPPKSKYDVSYFLHCYFPSTDGWREQTAFRRDIKDNGYKSVFTNLWLERQRNRSWIRD